jgi:hypothetical protein
LIVRAISRPSENLRFLHRPKLVLRGSEYKATFGHSQEFPHEPGDRFAINIPHLVRVRGSR